MYDCSTNGVKFGGVIWKDISILGLPEFLPKGVNELLTLYIFPIS